MSYRNEKKVPTLNEQGKLDHKFLPTGISVPVTKKYVDDGDQASKDYTDQKISEIDFPDGDITEAEVDAKDATTLANAKTYTDTKIGEIDFPEGDITEAAVDAKDATTLTSAKKYSDDNTTAVSSTVSNIVDNYIPEKNAETLASANAYTDTKISEIDFPDTGVPESEIDAKDDVTLAKAKEYVDALPEDFQKISVTSLDEVSSDFSGLIEVEPPEFIFRKPELGGSLELVSSNPDARVRDLYEFDDDGNPVALNLRNSEELTFTFSSVSRPVGVGIYFTIPALPQLTTEELQQSGWGINSDFMNLKPGVRYEQNGNDWDAIHDTWSVNVAGYNVTNIAPGASLDFAVYQAMDGEVVSFINGVEVRRSGGADSGYPILGNPIFTMRGLNFTNLRDVPAIPVSKYYLQVEDHEPVRLVGKDAIATWLQWDIVTKVDLRKAIENIPLPTADVTKSYVDTELAKKADTSHTHTTSQVTDLDVALAGKASTVHSHTKSDVGLGNVDNTSDANKPVSTATQTALNAKAGTTHTHTKSDVGLGNVDNTSDLSKPVSTATQTALNTKANTSHTHVKADVGLGNVDNTSDADKPVSTATATALAGKANTVHTHTKSDVGLSNVDNTSDANKPVSVAQQTALDGKASTAQGLPTGGTTGQVLAKTSGTSYETGWVTPTGGSFGLTGPGRPDVPAGTGLANEIASAPVGTLYNSTDGAGAGAWAWRKRPAGWVVVDGDTGLRRFVLTGGAFPANGSYVEYRRRQDAVSFQINSTNAGAWRINAIPSGGTVGVLAAQPGFRPSSGAMAELNSDGRARLGAFLMQLPPNDGGGALQIRPFEAIAANSWVRVPLMTWLTLDDWPTTLPGIAV